MKYLPGPQPTTHEQAVTQLEELVMDMERLNPGGYVSGALKRFAQDFEATHKAEMEAIREEHREALETIKEQAVADAYYVDGL